MDFLRSLRVCDHEGHLFVVHGHGTGVGDAETLWSVPVCARCGAHAEAAPPADTA